MPWLLYFSENQSDDCQEQGYSFKLFNQQVVGFSADPYQLESRSDLPDIVVAGVLQGLYPRDVKVSFKKSCSKPRSLTCVPELPAHPKIPIITINRSNICSLPESQRTWVQCCLATPSALNMPSHHFYRHVLCESQKKKTV